MWRTDSRGIPVSFTEADDFAASMFTLPYGPEAVEEHLAQCKSDAWLMAQHELCIDIWHMWWSRDARAEERVLWVSRLEPGRIAMSAKIKHQLAIMAAVTGNPAAQEAFLNTIKAYGQAPDQSLIDEFRQTARRDDSPALQVAAQNMLHQIEEVYPGSTTAPEPMRTRKSFRQWFVDLLDLNAPTEGPNTPNPGHPNRYRHGSVLDL